MLRLLSDKKNFPSTQRKKRSLTKSLRNDFIELDKVEGVSTMLD